MIHRASSLFFLAAFACSSVSPDPVERPAPVHTVDAGADQRVTEGSLVTLTGIVSEGHGEIVTTWRQTAGPAVGLEGAETLTATFLAPETKAPVGLSFRLEAVDAHGGRVFDDVVVVVVSANLPPVVDAGPDQVVFEGETVVLSGSATDADGTVASTRWVQTVGETVVLADPDALETSFTAPDTTDVLTLAFRLEAVDDEGAVGFDDVTVQVVTAHVSPTVDAGEDQRVLEGDLVTLSGTTTATAPTSILWTQFAGPEVALADATALETTFTAPATDDAVVLGFRLEVVDAREGSAVGYVLVTVLHRPNVPPAVDAGPDQTVTSGDLVTLAGSASDEDGEIVRTTWTEIGTDLVTFSDPSALYATFTAPEVGFVTPITLRLEVEDDAGAIAADEVTITVHPLVPVNRPPVVYAGADQTVASGSVVTLSGAAEDPDGTVVETTWTQIAGPPVEIDDPGALETLFTAPEVACAVLLVFELEAVDDEGARGSDRVSIVVDGVMADPIAVGGPIDIETSDGGLVTEGDLWEWGVPTSGPGGAWSGTRVWATNLHGNYPGSTYEVLCLPPLDLSEAVEPILTFRSYMRLAGGDGFTVEGLDPNAGWVPLANTVPAMTRVVAGRPSFASTSPVDDWYLHAVSLPPWLGEAGRVRLVFSSDSVLHATGVYLDEIRIDEEDSDPDGDGLVGILGEWLVHGTDPFIYDTDGDGFGDGAEVAAGTDPLNPADWPGRPSLPARFELDFEADDGGLVAAGSTWQHGTPASGPGGAHSGVRVWATNLSGNYGAHERAYLYLPPLDLSETPEPTLSARLWLNAGGGDGLSVEVRDPDTGAWVQLDPALPAYESTDALGRPAWRNRRFRNEYRPIALSLNGHVRDRVMIRLAFRSDGVLHGPGAYLDNLAVYDESDDPDGDGLPGILGEWLVHGTDPFLADTDGDGWSDGAEVAAGTDPLNPADYPGRTSLTPGFVLDFDADGGGLVTDGTTWQHGTPASGPGGAWSGTRVWATNLSGNYGANERAYLYLPPLDLSETPEPTLSARLWLNAGGGDGLSVEVQDPATGEWAQLDPALPAYESTDALGRPAWRNRRYRTEYRPIALSLNDHVRDRVMIRFAFRSDGVLNGPGAYLDDVAVHDESDDPDGDGLPGILGEWLVYGTDPFIADTDGDGVSDGDEVAAGTDPLDPADHPGAVWLLPGDLLDFEEGPDGLATTGSDWRHGVIASGPGTGWSGTQGWATNLSGNYGANWRQYLYLPPIDLTGGEEARLTFRLWLDARSGDGLSVERLNAAGEWATLLPETPAYDATDALGRPAWRNQRDDGDYVRAEVSLVPWAGQVVRLRLAFRSDGVLHGPGAYVDDVAIDAFD